jgi:hypothetical protein
MGVAISPPMRQLSLQSDFHRDRLLAESLAP